MKNVLLLSILLSAFSLPAVATAQEADVQGFYDAGAEYYVKGEYARAIVEFRKAHAHSPNAFFLYNIALAERNLGKCSEAISAAQNALDLGGLDDKTATKTRALTRGCRVKLEAVDRAEAAAEAMVAATSKPDATTPATGLGIETKSPTSPPPDEGFGTLGWTGATLAFVGTGALVGGSILAAQLDETYETYETTTDIDTYNGAEEDLESGRPIAFGLLIGGGALVAVGLGLVIFEFASGDEAVTASVGVDPEGPSVSIEGRF